MRKLLAILCAILCATSALASDPPIEYVNKLADDVIHNILESSDSMDQKLVRFEQVFTKVVDLRNVGQFVLGVYWKRASEAEREEFLKVFMDFTTKTWADRFNLYTGQKVVFLGSRNAERGQLYVDSQIQNNPPVEVIWRLRKAGDSYRIIDIVIENVSMVMTYRNEYTAFLQSHQGSLPALISELRTKAENFKFTTEK